MLLMQTDLCNYLGAPPLVVAPNRNLDTEKPKTDSEIKPISNPDSLNWANFNYKELDTLFRQNIPNQDFRRLNLNHRPVNSRMTIGDMDLSRQLELEMELMRARSMPKPEGRRREQTRRYSGEMQVGLQTDGMNGKQNEAGRYFQAHAKNQLSKQFGQLNVS